MGKLDINGQLYGRLKAVREEVRREFDALRIKGESGDISGKGRLERVPALRKREFTEYLVGICGEPKREQAAWMFLDFIRGSTKLNPLARAGIRSNIEKRLDALRQSEGWLEAASQLAEALGASGSDNANSMEIASVVPPSQAGDSNITGLKLAAPPASPGVDQLGPVDAPTGKSTGARKNHIGELCHVEAEWRLSNLGPNEERWLQLLLRFERSYTRAYTREGGHVELDIHVHRIHVEAVLDGGQAATRDPWIKNSGPSGVKVEIFQGNAWASERPCYEVDNPIRNEPLLGNYDWFDLCEVSGEVGDNALLEISASISGIAISLPKEIRDQLDPTKDHPYDTPEERLINGWLRNRTVPRSCLTRGGLYQLTQIELKKRLP